MVEICSERQDELCMDCKALGILFWGFCPMHQSLCRPQAQILPDEDTPEEITPEITGEGGFEFSVEQTGENGVGFMMPNKGEEGYDEIH